MNINRFLYLFVAIALAVVGALTVREVLATTSIADSMSASYQTVLGKSLNDKGVAAFIASNNCSIEAQTNSGQWRLCRDAGMALWIDYPHLMVRTVYLYPANTDGFTAYKGELPFGLAANDTMAMIEQKLGHPKEVHAPQAGWMPGLPDESRTSDPDRYWAIYKRFDVTIVYNTPSADDKTASIHAILISK